MTEKFTKYNRNFLLNKKPEAINQDVLWRTPVTNEFLVKMNGNNLPMWMTFIDYEKVTD